MGTLNARGKQVKLRPRGKMRKQHGYQSCLSVRVFVIFGDVSRNVTRDNHAIDVMQCHTSCILPEKIMLRNDCQRKSLSDVLLQVAK